MQIVRKGAPYTGTAIPAMAIPANQRVAIAGCDMTYTTNTDPYLGSTADTYFVDLSKISRPAFHG